MTTVPVSMTLVSGFWSSLLSASKQWEKRAEVAPILALLRPQATTTSRCLADMEVPEAGQNLCQQQAQQEGFRRIQDPPHPSGYHIQFPEYHSLSVPSLPLP